MSSALRSALVIREATRTDLALLERDLDGSTGRTMSDELKDQNAGKHSLFIAIAHENIEADSNQLEQGRDSVQILGGGFIRWLGPRAKEVYERYPETPEIYRLGVNPAYQSRGIGQRLIAAMEAAAVEQGYQGASLGVALANPRAQSLYTRLGYRTSSISQYDDRYQVIDQNGEFITIVDPCTFLIKDLYPAFSIRGIEQTLPNDLASMAQIATQEGHVHVSRLIEEWQSGVNRFSQTGETLIRAIDAAGNTIGVVGLNRDPYYSGVNAGHPPGRVRRMYVLPQWRRQGVARALLRRLELRAQGEFTCIQLYTSSANAGRFYVAMGYQPAATTARVNTPDKVSHQKAI